ncbi:HAD family hydrolase [Coralloluteibacterium thermophilus]|uniref:HAD family hydrolase n=1 Tax=Coralloluteibacterium thermophilum TaxID=2707049 RepID=A0ABV9NMT9_9GAMM
MQEEAAAAVRGDLALFDFDGTITTRETLPDFLRLAVPPRRLAIGKVVLAPLVVGYRIGLVPGTLVRSVLVRVGFAGVPAAATAAHGADFAARVLPGLLRPEAMARIAWHKARGDTVAVVSGGFDVYLKHWCDAHGLALLCSSLEEADGRLTGRYRGAQCVRREKVRRVLAEYDLSAYARVYAYGDTREDLDLLGLAHEATYRWARWQRPGA